MSANAGAVITFSRDRLASWMGYIAVVVLILVVGKQYADASQSRRADAQQLAQLQQLTDEVRVSRQCYRDMIDVTERRDRLSRLIPPDATTGEWNERMADIEVRNPWPSGC